MSDIRDSITDELLASATLNRTPARSDLDVPLLTVGGLPIAVIDRPGSAHLMVHAALARRGSGLRPLLVTSANGQVLSMCARDAEPRALFLAADLIHADGMPLVFASRRRCRAPLPERIATTDLFHDVAKVAETTGATFYLLGATQETIETARARIQSIYPGLVIAGFRNGYFAPEEEAQVIADINAARPDILWVGMGVPWEQAFCVRNRARLTNVGLMKTSGGLFDFVSGRKSRAPLLLQSVGLEWLYRLALEPCRLLLRYLTTNPHALYLLLTRTPGGVDR